MKLCRDLYGLRFIAWPPGTGHGNYYADFLFANRDIAGRRCPLAQLEPNYIVAFRVIARAVEDRLSDIERKTRSCNSHNGVISRVATQWLSGNS